MSITDIKCKDINIDREDYCDLCLDNKRSKFCLIQIFTRDILIPKMFNGYINYPPTKRMLPQFNKALQVCCNVWWASKYSKAMLLK